MHPTRDFTYVTDAANGFVKCLKLKSHGEVLNLEVILDFNERHSKKNN